VSTPAALAAWADACQQVESTRSRLEKAAHIGALFAALGDDDLARCAPWTAGHAFEIADGRTVGVGHATVLRVLERLGVASPDDLRARLVRLGDPGTLAHEVLPPRDASLTPADLEAMLAALAGTRKRADQDGLIGDLLDRATPLEARYIVRLLAGDLRIGVKEAGVEDAIARAFEAELEDVRRANMLTGSLGEAAVRARSGTLAEARMKLHHPIAFMLAQSADSADELADLLAEGLAIEDKFDGIRCQAHVGPPSDAPMGRAVGPRHVALFSRQRSDVTASFPDVAEALAADLPEGEWIVDGEIVALTDDGSVASFASLQKRLGRKRVTEQMRADVPAVFVAYDVIYAGELVTERPLAERRRLLEGAFGERDRHARLSAVERWDEVTEERLDERFRAARERGNEGLMAKSLTSTYTPGKRGAAWRKVKRALATLDVVVTSVERGSGKRSTIYSDYTFAVRASEDDGTLLNIGKAYSGLTDAELDELSAWFVAHTTQQFAHGRVRLVEPGVVLEVAFDAVQESKRHKSGYALRFPRIVRLRADKTPDEIDTLAEVARLAS
jgi:DNA ligase-1